MDKNGFDAKKRAVLLAQRVGLALALVAVLAGNAWSAAGDLDLGFGSGGMVSTDFGALAGEEALAVALQPDGKIVAAGYSTSGANYVFAIARYGSIGVLDGSFGSGGIVTTTIGDGSAMANGVTLQSDGNIVLAGSSVSGAKTNITLARYISTTGALDSSFGTGGVVTSSLSTGSDVARGVAIQPDGKIVVGGNASGQLMVARYTITGTLDTSFGPGGKATLSLGAAAGNAVALQSDGKIVLAGHSDRNSTDDFAVVRFTITGTLDTSFNSINGYVLTDFGGGNDLAHSVAVQSDGKIVVAGYTNAGVGHNQFAAARYNPNGTLDTSFGTSGKLTVSFGTLNDQANVVALQPTGRIVLAGSSQVGLANAFALARHTISGTLDTSFGVGGLVTTTITTLGVGGDSLLHAAAIQPDGMIVAAGSVDQGGSTGLDFALARYQSPNTPPTITDLTRTALENASIAFSQNDFVTHLADADGDQLVRVKVASPPADGVLSLHGTPVKSDQEIWAFDLGYLTYTPTQYWNGDAVWGWNGSDGQDYALTGAVVTMTILPVNQAPRFTGGADQRVRVGSGVFTATHWAANISAGAPNESSQVLTFTLTAGNPTVLAGKPVINATTGDLVFTPSAHVWGSSVVTVTLGDSGGTANGGVDTSPPETFTITVIPYSIYLPLVLR